MMKTFLLRTFSTVLLLTLFGCAMFLPGGHAFTVFSLLVILLSYFTVYEFTVILKNSGHPVDTHLTALFVTATAVLTLFQMYQFALVIAVIFGVHCWLLFLTSKNEDANMQVIFYSAGTYLLFTLPICLMVNIYLQGVGLFLYLVLVTKIADIAAYVTGTVSNAVTHGGNHKLIPSISPGKSWEGAVGGFIFTVLCSWLLWRFVLGLTSWWQPLMAGAVLFLGSMAGDLAESAFKRTCRIKDSGHTLPGIGGILDLVDSLMINTALFWLFLTFCPDCFRGL